LCSSDLSVPDPQPTAQLPSNTTIRSRPTAYSTVTIQHNNLNRKKIIQNQKKNVNITKIIYLTYMHCTNNFRERENWGNPGVDGRTTLVG
jgi:hypothetical protein